MAENMEDEIDLRQYVVVLIKYWYWIIGLTIAAAVAGFGVSTFLSPTYQATALVTVAKPRYQLQFDPRFANVPEVAIQGLLQSQVRNYPTLATSDEIFQQLAQATGWSTRDLQIRLEAETNSDPNLLELTVKDKNAEEAAQVANKWAEIFVATVNKLYGGDGELEHFKQQQEEVALTLAKADAALTTFRAENGFGFANSNSNSSNTNNSVNITMTDAGADPDRFGLLGRQIQARSILLTNYEEELVRLRQMQGEIDLLSTSTTNTTSPVLIAGLLSEMINNGVIKEEQAFQVKLDTVDPVAALAAMKKALAARVASIEAEITPLQADIASMQAELANKQQQLDQLTRERDVTAETYMTLSRKVQETQLDIVNKQVKVASQATAPVRPVSPQRLLNTILAGALGLLIGVFGVFVMEWWRKGQIQPLQQQSGAIPVLSATSPHQDRL
jgi:uncharacterized protein involved in exopolysaccharide biosynthesis